nr:DNA cytosine methyltransferase [Bacillus toyonensis]
MKMTYRVGSMFAGIGGTCLGFKEAGAKIIWASEIDKNACITYRENFGESYLLEGDITKVDKTTIPQLDILIAGFPCQAFSVAGYRKGFEDDRGNLFFQVIEVIEAQKEKPKAIMLENVKNLVGHDKGNTFKIIKKNLEDKGYTIKYKVLNSMEYGNVPQNRERIYVVGFLDKKQADAFEFPEPIPLTNKLNTIIDRENKLDDKFYYNESSQYYEMLSDAMISHETTYQLRRVYVRENKSNVCPTLTANMGTGGHNVPLILDYNGGIRKLTPRECLLLQGFPKNYRIPEKMANSHLYKQAGNSVSVPVIKRIANNIINALNGQAISNE